MWTRPRCWAQSRTCAATGVLRALTRVYGPKVRLELHSVRQVLRIRPECLARWVAATVRRFTWVVDMDLSSCGIDDGVLECAGNLPQLTSLKLG